MSQMGRNWGRVSCGSVVSNAGFAVGTDAELAVGGSRPSKLEPKEGPQWEGGDSGEKDGGVEGMGLGWHNVVAEVAGGSVTTWDGVGGSK